MAALPPILLVDDEPDDLLILRRLLAKAEVKNKVVAFEDPIAALEFLDLESRNGNPLYVPCLVFTDLNMPVRNGVEITSWIRAHPLLKDMRVVMVSDSENPADEKRARAAGVNEFLRKYPTAQMLAQLAGDLPCVPQDEATGGPVDPTAGR